MRFEFVAKHRGIWPVSWICEALGVSRSGFHAWLVRAPSARARSDEEFGAKVRASFISSYRTGTVSDFVGEAGFVHQTMTLSPKIMANGVLASHHSRGGRIHCAAA